MYTMMSDQLSLKDNTITQHEKQHELKLRIINEALTSKRNYFTTCYLCLCCTDFIIAPLSFEERIIKLTIGFIRKYATDDMGPDICSLCIDYVGQNFNEGRWRTNRQILMDQLYRLVDFTDTCDPDDVIRKCCCWNICGFIAGALWYIIGISSFIGKDIAGLVIVANNVCDDAIYGGGRYVLFDIDDWLITACIVHLIYSIMYWCPCICCWTDFERWRDRTETILFMPIVCCFGCFFIPWMVIGFLLYSEMNGYGSKHSDCKNIVLSWCILQGIESLIAPIIYILFQGFCTFHDE